MLKKRFVNKINDSDVRDRVKLIEFKNKKTGSKLILETGLS